MRHSNWNFGGEPTPRANEQKQRLASLKDAVVTPRFQWNFGGLIVPFLTPNLASLFIQFETRELTLVSRINNRLTGDDLSRGLGKEPRPKTTWPGNKYAVPTLDKDVK
jgi:hypothetical protein